jgi:uncharacterized SAM-binding protein YcdF (DUF218 family)
MTAFEVLSVLFFCFFCLGVFRDLRSFSNAVFLGLSLSSLAIGIMGRLGEAGHPPALVRVALATGVLLAGLGVFMLAFFLIANGVRMVRNEGRRPANLLSLLAGLGILGLVALVGAAVATRSPALIRGAGAAFLVAGYVSFLFACFIGYALGYGRLRVRQDVDYVVVLGSGLTSGSRVPPLLASRLDRGRELYLRQAARGNPPVVITSGGQGPRERLPEARAMADYLVQRGIPSGRVECEERSRNTEQNLRFSKAIMQDRVPGYRCVVVTSNFHVFRAAITARRTGVNGQVVGSRTAAYFWPSATIREFAAVFLSHKVVNLGICLLLGLFGLFGLALPR